MQIYVATYETSGQIIWNALLHNVITALCVIFLIKLWSPTPLPIHYLHNPIIHLFYAPKILHNHCLQVLLGREDVLREIKNNAYANFWGVKEVYYGIWVSSELVGFVALPTMHQHIAPPHYPSAGFVALPTSSCKQRWRKQRFVSKDGGKVSQRQNGDVRIITVCFFSFVRSSFKPFPLPAWKFLPGPRAYVK